MARTAFPIEYLVEDFVEYLVEDCGDDPAEDFEDPVEDPARGPVDTLQCYMRDVGGFSLLSPEEEKRLARRIEEGQGDTVREARDQLVVANLRFVVLIAKKNEWRGRAHGLDLLDLIQEGNLGLLKAAESFESGYGKFSTFAEWWIQGEINQALADQGRAIRIPVHVHKQLDRLRQEENWFLAEKGCLPTLEDLAEELDIDIGSLVELRAAEEEVISIEQTMPDDEEDAVCDDFALDPESEALAQRVVDRQWLAGVLPSLDKRSRRILEGHFVLGLTFVEIGSQENVSRERVRQILRAALGKLAGRYN